MATDLTFCKKIFKFTIDNVNGSHYQLAWSLFKINYLSTALDIENGLYHGRLADLVEIIRQLFRGDAISKWAEDRSTPEGIAKPGHLRDVWGDIATFIYPWIKLDLKTEPVNTSNSTSRFDTIELAQIIPNHVKDWENNQFHTYFSNRDNRFAPLLRIVDPKIGEIMDVDIDDDGNKLDGEELTLLHAKRINVYFASIGQPDLLGQVWPSIADPNEFTMTLDQVKSEQVDGCKTQ